VQHGEPTTLDRLRDLAPGARGTAALRDFYLADVGSGSFTTDAVEATRACMSAVARKRTSNRSSRQVRLVPQAVTSIIAAARSSELYLELHRRRSAMTNCIGRELILIKFVPGASANLLRMPAKEADHEMHLDRHRAACSC
jgi:hypothetical protein